MKIYVVNLVVNAKNTDIYDKVSLNKYPIVIKCNAEHELKKILNQDTAKQFLLDNIKSQKIYETAQWYI